MAKRTGLGQKFYIVQIGSGPAYDISGDVGSIDTADCMVATLDVTGIDKSAHERIPGLGDGKLQYTGFWDNAAGGQHAVVHALDGLPVRGLWCGSANEGDGLAFAVSGILTNYPATRAAGGALTAKPTIDGYSGDLPDWGFVLANATDASGTVNHTAVDFGMYGAQFTISGNTIANPTVVTTTTPHGYQNGDSVNITNSNSTPSINGDYVVSNVTSTTFTIPVNVTGTGSQGTVQKTSSRLGGVLTAVLLSIGSGTNYTLQWQTSADNGVADAYTNVASLVTSALTAAAAESRVRLNNVLIKRWNRLVGAGTYTNAAVVAIGKRYQGTE
jgi:hypothetical protein